MNKYCFIVAIACVLTGMLGTSCISTKNAVYFYNLKDTSFRSNAEASEAVIQKNDILGVSISSPSSEASSFFNTDKNFVVTAAGTPGNATQTGGYLVGSDGTIQLPVLGTIRAEGLTKGQLKEYITKLLLQKKLLLDPMVTIRHLNFKVTVLGEVAHPTVITVPSEKITLLEAIGLAGDLTIYAKRDNVLLIREENGVKKTKRINLNASEILNSPLYYLRSNDVVYVEPNKAKVAGSSQTKQLLPLILSALSVTAVIISRL